MPEVAVASTGGKPAYCGAHNYAKHSAKELHSWFDDPKKGRYELHFLVKLHQALCSSETAVADRSDLESMRHTVLTELGLTEADTRDLPKLLDLGTSDAFPDYFQYTTERPSAEGTARASSTSPIDQMYMLVASNHWFYKTRWLVDAWGDAMTESARASYINLCLHDEGHGKPVDKALDYAWCSDDVKHLDRAKYTQELAALSPELRFVAKFDLGTLLLRVAAFEKEIARDPKLAKIAIEMPRKIGDDWRAFTKANRSLVDHVRAVELVWIDDGHAADDCRASLAADWKHAVAATPVEKALAPSQGVAQTSRKSYLASVGMSRCAAGMPGYEDSRKSSTSRSHAHRWDAGLAPRRSSPRSPRCRRARTTRSRRRAWKRSTSASCR